jgi:hypothetical protein
MGRRHRRYADMSMPMEVGSPRPDWSWTRMKQPPALITITEERTPKWGATAHDATLTCAHGVSVHTVFGEAQERFEKAAMMAPGHRSRHGCQCEVAADDREAVAV